MAREYYSIPEAALLLGLSRIAVFKRVKLGRLQALRIGRNWAIPADALPLAVIAPAAVPPPPPPTPSAAKKSDPGAFQGGFTSDEDLDSMGWD